MKILAIQPPAEFVRQGKVMAHGRPGIRMEFPIFLAYVASVLREKGHQVQVIDAVAEELPFDEIRKSISLQKPDVVIAETHPLTFQGDLLIADFAKEARQECYTVYYGWQATAKPADVLANKNVDFAVRGEPELTIGDLVSTLEISGDLGIVKGISFKRNNAITHNPPRPFIENLDDLPYPARDLFPLEKYIGMPFGKITTVTLSRGCPYECKFCATHLLDGNQTRSRNPEQVIDEMQHVTERFGIRTFFFFTSNFCLLGERKLNLFCNEITRRKLKIRWLINSRVDTLPSLNTLRNMAKAGCFLISFGVESGSLTMIKEMRKGRDAEECERYVAAIKPAFERTKKAGIFTIANMLVGIPGESFKTIAESVRLIKGCNVDLSNEFDLVVPFPGTAFGYEAELEGIAPSKMTSSLERKDALRIMAGLGKTSPEHLVELRSYANMLMKGTEFRKKLKLAPKLLRYIARTLDRKTVLLVAKTVVEKNVSIVKKLNAETNGWLFRR